VSHKGQNRKDRFAAVDWMQCCTLECVSFWLVFSWPCADSNDVVYACHACRWWTG